MFCKYCGKKIESLTVPCPHCQNSQGELQSTDGYFGILKKMSEVGAAGGALKGSMGTKDTKADPRVAGMELENSKLQQNLQKQSGKIQLLEEQLRKMKLILMAVAGGAAVLLILVIIIFSVLLSKAKSDNADNDRKRPATEHREETPEADESPIDREIPPAESVEPAKSKESAAPAETAVTDSSKDPETEAEVSEATEEITEDPETKSEEDIVEESVQESLEESGEDAGEDPEQDLSEEPSGDLDAKVEEEHTGLLDFLLP